MSSCWKRMSSGRYIDIVNFTEDSVDIEDIATALNHITRFTGHHKDNPPLTVAQHSALCLLMAELFEPDDHELHLAVFTHDFAEAYVGDVATPVKRAMGKFWYDFAYPIEKMVEGVYFGQCMDQEMHHRVKLYDLAALDIERRMMWSSQYGKDKWPACPLNVGTMEDKRRLFQAAADTKNVDVQRIWKELYDLTYNTQ